MIYLSFISLGNVEVEILSKDSFSLIFELLSIESKWLKSFLQRAIEGMLAPPSQTEAIALLFRKRYVLTNTPLSFLDAVPESWMLIALHPSFIIRCHYNT